MLTLNPAILAAVVTEAERSAAQHPRWIAAIGRAAVELAENPYIEAQDDHTLLIGSESGAVYTANGIYSCSAYKHGQPCKHRAAARLYTRYLEAESKVAQPTPVAPLSERLAKARAEMMELFA